MAQAQHDRGVRARPRGQVHHPVVGQLDPARIDRDQLAALQRRLLDPGADDRVTLVGLTPISTATSAWSMSENEPVAPDSPNDLRIANEVGEWQTREQLSMLLVPIAARISRCIA